jgi:hypothetical protein
VAVQAITQLDMLVERLHQVVKEIMADKVITGVRLMVAEVAVVLAQSVETLVLIIYLILLMLATEGLV